MITTPYHGEQYGRYFIDCCRTKLMKEYLPKIESAVALLNDDDIWWRAHETNNSIGNLILHLSGNIRQWVYHHLAGNAFVRDRDKEFSERTQIPKAQLLEVLRNALKEVDDSMAQFPEEKLFQRYHIQNYDVTALEAILHITEHFSYHVGQIIYIAKLRTGKDLKFYNF